MKPLLYYHLSLRTSLHQASASMQNQRCDDALIENNGNSRSRMCCNLFWSDAIVCSESCITSVIAASTLERLVYKVQELFDHEREVITSKNTYIKVCLHVSTPSLSPCPSPSKFNIVTHSASQNARHPFSPGAQYILV